MDAHDKMVVQLFSDPVPLTRADGSRLLIPTRELSADIAAKHPHMVERIAANAEAYATLLEHEELTMAAMRKGSC